MDIVFETMIEHDIKKCFKEFGVEGTEEAIKRTYVLNIGVRDAYLLVYNKILNARKNAMKKYEIRKVKYGEHDTAVSYRMDEDVDFDVYGVYTRNVDRMTKFELLKWVNDYNTLLEAEAFVNMKVLRELKG